MKTKFALFIALLLSSSFVFAGEVYCALDSDSEFKFKQIKLESGDTINKLIYPKVKGATLHRVDLRYGKLETKIRNEIYTNLAFRELGDRYEANIHLSSDHEPLRINSIYHLEHCFSNIFLSIESGEITVHE